MVCDWIGLKGLGFWDWSSWTARLDDTRSFCIFHIRGYCIARDGKEEMINDGLESYVWELLEGSMQMQFSLTIYQTTLILPQPRTKRS